MFDVIGDIHGHAAALEQLLRRLGYQYRYGTWRYPGAGRRAVFVGDFIDRGPAIRDTVDIVRRMLVHEGGRLLHDAEMIVTPAFVEPFQPLELV
ncbi:MAG: metallophosphoesterase, partial [Alkalispirochaeta sp.]